MKLEQILPFLFFFILSACSPTNDALVEKDEVPFIWENATVYFLLTDRFQNGDPTNDQNYGRAEDYAPLRGFMGGDIEGVIQKIEEGYFTDLGVNAIWMTPVVEQIHGGVDEGSGKSYGFHGYWAKDWTTLDSNFGSMENYGKLVKIAHAKGIRIIMDVVMNHTGPVTMLDPQWPADWVRTSPNCTYQNYESTVNCTLVDNLPDILTGGTANVALPQPLVDKWKVEGRYEAEMAELDSFFERTGYPRAPKYYLIKWLADYVREFGVDGFRIDTVKHVEAGVWGELYKELVLAFNDWKANHPEAVLDDNDFYMVGEVYGYAIHNGQNYSYDGDTLVNFYAEGMSSIINFSLKYEVREKTAEQLFSQYSQLLNTGELAAYSVMNYMSSHDDGSPFDAERTNVFETANYLMLTPGAAQIYYGDETARLLNVEEAEGDAKLRSFMNWNELNNDVQRDGYTIHEILHHYQKLGQFRRNHPSVGAGLHQMLQEKPYVFTRSISLDDYQDQVIISMEEGLGVVPVGEVFGEGEQIRNFYTNEKAVVKGGKVSLSEKGKLILLEKI
ncbi:MAG: alpha-amylase [Marivirga sp.]|jgi:alpha-amylase